MLRKTLLVLFMILLADTGLLACSLPAEPCAAIVPVNAADSGMELITAGNSFYYLVPQGATASFKVVWDPAAHNTGGGLQSEKYEWCVKAGIAKEGGTDEPNGFGYFPIQSMADFFTVKGNRNSIQEAFARENNMSTSDSFMPSITGAYDLLSNIVKGGQIGKVTNVGGTSTEYPSVGVCKLRSMTDTPVNSAIDNNFPNIGWMQSEIPITADKPPQKLKVYRKNAEATEAAVISAEGLLIEGLEMSITELKPEDFKAFVRTGNPGASIEVQSTPALVWSADGANGTPGPDFEITFNTPSFTGELNQSRIQLKVWSPGAGYEISNMFWAWKEVVYTKSSKRVVTKNEVRNASGVVVIPEESEMREIWVTDNEKKLCSEEILLKLVKPADEAGSTDFVVYDTRSPIAANFKIAATDKLFKPTGATTFDFKLDILDTNPFFDKAFSTKIGETTLLQSAENLDLQVYYTYPVYEYSEKTGLSISALKAEYAGLADLDNPKGEPSFKTFKHKTLWTWKKAEVKDLVIGAASKLPGSSGKFAGAHAPISGKLTIKQPRPWHECNEGGGKSTPEPVFKVFAISKDSAGNAPPMHDAVKKAVGESKLSDTANPDAFSKEFAFNPANGSKLPTGELSGQVSGGGIDKSGWSNLELLKAKDETGPEIQVIVFDTRTNRCHMFGTGKNVAAGFSEFGTAAMKEDYSSGEVPYLGKEAEITAAHQLTDLGNINELFDRYLQGPDAVSTVSDGSRKGFVCQQNNRLVFYIRAVDNINSYQIDKSFGIKTLKYSLTDKAGVVKNESISAAGMLDPMEYVFRFENVDDSGSISPEYSLVVNATDQSDNKRELKLAIAVMGRKIDIRTLEERRERID
ncbi:MAG TPA: hypothetical protein PLM07_09760 [Candidatus Rifleibacterium sp.]|nr:hypothetical protein [Candidatus Rifleibacterium sp.]HPT46172.1 hypothetical protein [Candidatus Rifleibacterium sp.]